MNLTPKGNIFAIERTELRKIKNIFSTGFSLKTQVKVDRSLPLEIMGSVAVIKVRGVLEKLPSFFLSFFNGTSTAMIRQAIKKAVADDKITSIMLVIDSPGGSVDGMAEVADAIFNARKFKTVIAQVDGMAASAGYWIASQADLIFAGRIDLIGSIGVFRDLFDTSKLFDELGVKAISIDTGEFKNAGTDGIEITDEQIDDFQRTIDAIQAEFLNAVKRGRKMSEKALETLAQGQLFIGTEALENGLIDKLQVFDETLATLNKDNPVRRSRAEAALRIARYS